LVLSGQLQFAPALNEGPAVLLYKSQHQKQISARTQTDQAGPDPVGASLLAKALPWPQSYLELVSF